MKVCKLLSSFLLLIFISYACVSLEDKGELEINEMNIEEALKDFRIVNLSDYVSEIRSVKIDYHHANKFLEYAEQLSNPDDSLKEFLKDLKEEDNPVIIIAKGKQ